jgi:hypothetical protein
VLTPTLFNIENALQEVGRRMLVLARDHYREERILKVRGHSGRWEIRSFMGADLGDSIDVQVQIGSSFPWSKAARQDLALSSCQAPARCLPPGSIDMTKVAKILDVGGIQAFEPETDPDETEVMLEHAQFEEYNPDKGVLSIPQPASGRITRATTTSIARAQGRALPLRSVASRRTSGSSSASARHAPAIETQASRPASPADGASARRRRWQHPRGAPGAPWRDGPGRRASGPGATPAATGGGASLQSVGLRGRRSIRQLTKAATCCTHHEDRTMADG